MSDKKVEVLEMAKSFSTIISTVAKSIQNDLGDFNKISEIIKIKFILNDIIKKREKMRKKSLAKKARKEVEDLKIKENINSKELNKFEKIKKFRDLEKINITYGDNEKDKFQDFQEMYDLINNKIEVQDKQWIYSEKDNIYYILAHKLITTEKLKGEYSIYVSSKEEKNNLNNIKKVSNRIREKGFEFSLPDEKSLKLLENIRFIGNGNWIYYSEKNSIKSSNYIYVSNSFNYLLNLGYNLLGIYKLDNFFKFIEDRNKKYNLVEYDNLKCF